MALSPGTRLGPYEVLAPLGAGGMGEVYRARDTRLDRDVALKVLPDLFVADPDRRARFEREAKVLAALNHSNIAQVFGFEANAIAMELVDGPTLADRIAAGALPVDEAMSIARQIAAALEAAHERGIVHRDLKPANVKVRDDGTVKVLDFGLAKALGPDDASGASSLAVDANSPTLTMRATEIGMILGTAAYMSPEQARGRAVDRRADIWAFGVVLYEMLTGRRAFDGEDVSDVLAAVLRADPDWSALPTDLPAPVHRLLRRCLEKDPKKRLRDIGEGLLQLDDALASGPSGATASGPVAPESGRGSGRVPSRAIAGVALGLVGVLLALWAPWRAPAPRPALQFSVDLGADASLFTLLGPAAVVSPDGQTIAFVASPDIGGAPLLHVRPLTSLQATPLSGTANARDPFFSPDGQWVGFFADGQLKKVATTGGAPVTIAEARDARGGTWADDDTIVFQPYNAGGAVGVGSLMRVPAVGGAPTPLFPLHEGEVTQRWPQVLPGGRAVLYTSHDSTIGGYEDATIVVQPLPTGERIVVQRGGYFARYVSSGHVLYMREGTLLAVPFDVERLAVTAPPVPVLEGVAANAQFGGAQFSVSDNGTLVYVAGEAVFIGNAVAAPVVWVDRAGTTVSLRTAPSQWADVRFDPDGRRVAFSILERSPAASRASGPDVWIYDLARETLSRLTFDYGARMPSWTPDGNRIAYSRDHGQQAAEIYWRLADGTGDAQQLTSTGRPKAGGLSWHPGGRLLAFAEVDVGGSGGANLSVLPIEGDEASGWTPGTPTIFLQTPFTETQPAFSPDGRWIAYASNETGRLEVYVRPFPGPGGKWQISTDGGRLPVWSRKQSELLFSALEEDVRIVAVPYAVEGETFLAGRPRPWSEQRLGGRLGLSWDLHADGARVAGAPAPERSPQAAQDKVVFYFNFLDDLRRLAPAR